jgi:hypothetical protein
MGILWSSRSLISGTVSYCASAVSGGFNHNISGVLMANNTYTIYYGVGHTISGILVGGGYALYYGGGHRVTGSILGTLGAFGYGLNNILDTSGTIQGGFVAIQQDNYTIIKGVIKNCVAMYQFGGSFSSSKGTIVRGGANVYPIGFRLQNEVYVNSQFGSGIHFENYQGIAGDHRFFLSFGNIVRNTTIVRTGGGSSSLEVIPLSNCSIDRYVAVLDWLETGVPASPQARSIFIKGEGWTIFPTAAQFYIEAEYISNATTFETSIVTTTAVLSDNVTWTEFALPSFTPAIVESVRYRAYLKTYEATGKIYVDCKLVGSRMNVIFVDGQAQLGIDPALTGSLVGTHDTDAIVAQAQLDHNSPPTYGNDSLLTDSTCKVNDVVFIGNRKKWTVSAF